jgi:hypothetical protein
MLSSAAFMLTGVTFMLTGTGQVKQKLAGTKSNDAAG